MLLDTALSLVYHQLNAVAQSPDYWTIFNTVFGSSYNQSLAQTLQQQWQAGNFSALPQIQTLSSEVLGSASGGYGASTNTIYLSESFLSAATPEQGAAVLLEEIGHYVDAQINSTDTLGDEGQLFSVLVRGEALATEQSADIKAENNAGKIIANEQSITVQIANALNTGDIAFTSFNADEDGWSIVTFVDIDPNTIIYFTDNEATSLTAFNTGESSFQWDTGSSTIAAGTVIRFSAIDAGTRAALISTFTVVDSTALGLSATNETVYAYLGTSAAAPTTFLTAVSSEGTTNLTPAGLTNGTDAIVLTNSTDFGQYNGSRSGEASFTDYKELVLNSANWTIDTTNDYSQQVPNTNNFTIATVTPTVNLSVSSNSGSEAGQTAITITATASSAVSGNQTVSLGVTGTNITGGDYILSNSTITILNGQTTGSVTFTVVDDSLFEDTETATLTLSNPSSGIALGINTSQNITITDNDNQILIALDASGNLVITDQVDTNDNLIISSNGNALIITDNSGKIIGTGINGATGSGTSTVTIPINSFTASIITNTVGGNDTLIVDFTVGANPIPTAGLTFNGGSQTSSPNGDQLALTGGTFTNTTYTYTNENDGSINLDGKVITYTGLEPIAATVTAANVILNYSTAAETITVTSANATQITVDSTAGEITTFNNPTGSLTINGGATGTNTFNLNSISSGFAADLTLNGSGYTNGDTVNLNADPHSNDFTIDLVQNINVATASSDITTNDTGDNGDVNWTAGQSINFASGSSLTTTNGLITLNAQGNVTGVDYIGVNVNNAAIASSNGNITVNGTGGGTGGGIYGVLINNGGKVQSIGNATITVTGQGSATGISDNHGILVTGANSTIASVDANITVNGTGGGTVAGNRGVFVDESGKIQSTGNGSVTVTGQGSATGTGFNQGVLIKGLNTAIAVKNGNLSVTGSTTSAGVWNHGIYLENGGQIQSTDSGIVNVTGNGSTNGTSFNLGLFITGAGSAITSSNGNILINATGGGTGSDSYGILLDNGGKITAIGTATINITTTGSATGGGGTSGIRILNTNTTISSTDGAITLNSTGGNGTSFNGGMVIGDNATITSTNGAIIVNSTGKGTVSENYGIFLQNGQINTTGNNSNATITVMGQGATSSTGSGNDGVRIDGTNSKITSIAGAIAITGTAGNGTNGNRGVVVFNNGVVTSATGNITVNGTGRGTTTNNHGVYVVSSGTNGGVISSTGTGANTATITITGQGSVSATSDNNDGVRLEGTNSKITSINGAINLTGTGGGTGGSAINLGVRIIGASEIKSTGTATINVTGTGGLGTNFNHGVYLSDSNSIITSATGNITVNGTGRGTGNNNNGVKLDNSAVISSTVTANIALEGIGSNGTNDNYGVAILNSSQVTSSQGAIAITGTASGTTSENYGVYLLGGGKVLSTGTGTITITGQGSTTATGNNNDGIRLNNGIIQSANGNIALTGTGGGSGTTQLGVRITAGGQVISTGNATINVTGFGGENGVGTNYGVQVFGTGSAITSTNGNITVNGTGRGTGTNNRGVSVEAGGVISSTGNATINVTGQGSTNAGTNGLNAGVRVDGTGSKITSENGAIAVTGTSGIGGTGTTFNYGVTVLFGGEISSTGTGANAATITVIGQGGATTPTGSQNIGVEIEQGGKITAVAGAIRLTGTGGSGTSLNHGVLLLSGSVISSGTGEYAATITVIGIGSTTASDTINCGIRLNNGLIQSLDGAIALAGTGGVSTNENYGVALLNGGKVASTIGVISITGQGSSGSTGSGNDGVRIESTNSSVNSTSGNIIITGTGGNGTAGNRGVLVYNNGLITSATGNITINGTGGGTTSDNYGIWLLAAGKITATDTAQISLTGMGNGTNSDGIRIDGSGSLIQSNSGGINLTGTGSGASFGINLINGGAINSTNGNVNLLASTINLGDTTQITTSGNVFINQDNDNGTLVGTTTLGATVNVTAGNLLLNDTIAIDYNSSLGRFDTLNLIGALDLAGSTLNLDWTDYTVPPFNTIYTLINNDSDDAITGIFAGLTEGAQIGAFSSYNAFITYLGNADNPSVANIGTGNDVQIYLNQAPTAVVLSNQTNTLPENTSTATRIKVADIAITDDALGTEAIALSGTDAASFEVDGTELYLKAGVALDFETKSSYAVTITVDDTSVGATPDLATNFTLTVTNINEPGTIQFSNSAYWVDENGTPINAITLTRTSGSDNAVSVTLTLSNGTATSISDYDKSPQTINFASGETSKTVNVPIVNDSLVEGNETINLTLTNPTGGASLGSQNTAVLTIVDDDTAPTPLYFSVLNNQRIGNLPVANEDIIVFDRVNFRVYFDGSAVGLSDLTIDAFDILSPTEILLSFSTATTLGNLSVDDSDLVKFTQNTTGHTFSLYFDGSDVGLTTNEEDLDALTVLANGDLLISTEGAFSVPELSGKGNDIVRFRPTSLGDNTQGTWSPYFTGDNFNLSAEGENVDALGLQPDLLYLSTTGNFDVPNLTGADEDIFRFTPTVIAANGAISSGQYQTVTFFDGNFYGLGLNDVTGVDFGF